MGQPVVWSDGAMAVVEKPAGLVVHQAPGHPGPTLVDELAGLLGGGEDPARPGIVHRLDKDTSGLMLVARTDEAHRRLAQAIREHRVERIYLALVEGVPASRTGTVDAPLGRDFRVPERRAVGGRGARAARTPFEVIEALPRDSLLEVRLETGRTHQVRAHMAAIDHPIAGDPRYGGGGRHGLARQFLHSHRLAFEHPLTGEWMQFSSELPDDLAQALARARAADSPQPRPNARRSRHP
jgi:23S rRNA pseudouridine1911/1915/1917 synthase